MRRRETINSRYGLSQAVDPLAPSFKKGPTPVSAAHSLLRRLVLGVILSCGIAIPAIAGVSFRDIEANFGLPNFTLLDAANLGDPTSPGHFNGLSFIETTYLVVDPRFSDQFGAVSTKGDPTDNLLGFVFDSAQTSVTLDVVTTTTPQTLRVTFQGTGGLDDFRLFSSGIFPSGEISIGQSETSSRGITHLFVSGSSPGKFGIDCIFFTDSPGCPNPPLPLPPRFPICEPLEVCSPIDPNLSLGLVPESVPEPTTALLLGSALFVMLAYRSRPLARVGARCLCVRQLG
jgi:hypothetical protein